MKRIILSAFLAVSVLIAGLAALPFVVSSQNIKTALDQQIMQLTGNAISYNGELNLTFSPYLGVELSDVVIAGNKQNEDDPDLLRIENLQFGLRSFALLFGKIQLSGFKLVRPKFTILVQKNGEGNWSRINNIIKSAKDTEQSGSTVAGSVESELRDASLSVGDITPGKFEIVDGIIETVIAGRDAPNFRVTNLHGEFDWPSLASPWDMSGKGVWRGESFEFSNVANNPLALMTSGRSKLKFSFNSPTVKASFNGLATVVSGVQFQGQTSISTPSLPRLLELLLGNEHLMRPVIGEFAIEGEMFANAREFRFQEAEVQLDSSVANGSLQLHWNRDTKSKISGTLAFSSLDLTPLIETVSVSDPSPVGSSAETLAQWPFDLDVRFSAENYIIKKSKFGALAAAVIVNQNEWAFDIGEADFFGGRIVATIASNNGASAGEIELKGIMSDVSMGDITRDWYGGDIIATGNTNINFNLKAPSETALGNFREFFGEMEITLTDGRIEGIDLAKAIPALNQNNGFVTISEIKGNTPFSNLSLNMIIYNGVGWITKGIANSDVSEFSLSGKADFIGGGLAIYTDIRQLANGDKIPEQARMFVGGTVRNPLVTKTPLTNSRPDEREQSDG
ncbi:MAG: AsmA family protein [Rhizobiaceae bacterium]|nr:AsmA family protein [Rhizobiaceae bacterium]